MNDRNFEAFGRNGRALIDAAGSPKPSVPDGGALIWSWFVELSNARSYGMHGAQALSFTEIESFGRSMAIPLRPGHVRLLRKMDDAWIAAKNQRLANHDRNKGLKHLPPASAHPISAALFDAVTS